MKKKSRIMLAITTALLSASGVLAAVVEQWGFSGDNPETGINGTSVSTWTTNAPNSVPSAGVLHYATGGQSAWKALPNVDTSTIGILTLTVQVSDMYVAPTEAVRFFLNSGNGATGHLESKLTSWSNGKFAPDILVGGTKKLDANTDISFASPSTGLGSALTMVTTWDFVNDTVSYDLSGPGAAGLGTTNWTAAAGVDLSAVVGTINAIQLKTSSTFTSWLDLDTVTIETLPIGSSAATPFEEWLIGHDLAHDLDPEADVNGDGISLFEAYALNLNPHAMNSPAIEPRVSNNTFEMSYYSAAPWVRYEPLVSTNLMDWTTNGVALTGPDPEGISTAGISILSGAAFLQLRADYPVLYVSPSGSGTNFTRSSPGAVSDALNAAPPGSRIVLLPGTYPRIDVDVSGAPEQPIILVSDSQNSDQYAVIDGGNTNGASGNEGMRISNASWLVIENLKFQNCWENIIELDNCSYITVRGCDFSEGKDVVHAKAGTHHVLLEYNTWKQREEIWYEWTWADVHHSEVQDLQHYHGSFYDGPWPGSGQNQAYGALVIRHNQGSHLFNWLAMWSCAPNLQANIEVYGNRVDYVRDNVIEPERYTFNLHVYHNEFNQCASGIFSLLHNTTTHDDPNMLLNGPMYVYGNIGFLDTSDLVPPEAIGPFDFDHSYAVVKNCKWFTDEPVVFYHNSWKYKQFGFSNDGDNDRQMHHFNNIGVYSDQYGYSFHSQTRFAEWGNVFDHDFSNKDWQSFVTNQGQESNSIVAPDPGWTDPANSDYRLQPGSVCIDAGKVIPGFTQSYDGDAPDIGAYEGDQLVEGPPFYIMEPPGGLGYIEKPRITRHRVAGSQLTLFWSWPLDPASVQDDQIVITADGRPVQVTGHSIAAPYRELVLTTDRNLEGAVLDVEFKTFPMGDNGETATLWGSTL